jgi:hypothetical protein
MSIEKWVEQGLELLEAAAQDADQAHIPKWLLATSQLHPALRPPVAVFATACAPTLILYYIAIYFNNIFTKILFSISDSIGIVLINLTTTIIALGVYQRASNSSGFIRINKVKLFANILIFSTSLLSLIAMLIWNYALSFSLFGTRDSFHNTTSHSISDAIYLAIITWGTVGYGDFSPVGASKAFAAVECLNGYFIMGVTLAALLPITALLAANNNRGEEAPEGRHGELSPRLNKLWVWKCEGCEAAAKVSEWSCGCVGVDWIIDERAHPGCSHPPRAVLGEHCKPEPSAFGDP